ncbi:MAG: hypothetical protein AB7G62_01285 [Magnetospirillum sp.]
MKKIIIAVVLVTLGAIPAIAAYEVHDVISMHTIKDPCRGSKISRVEYASVVPSDETDITGKVWLWCDGKNGAAIINIVR